MEKVSTRFIIVTSIPWELTVLSMGNPSVKYQVNIVLT